MFPDSFVMIDCFPNCVEVIKIFERLILRCPPVLEGFESLAQSVSPSHIDWCGDVAHILYIGAVTDFQFSKESTQTREQPV